MSAQPDSLSVGDISLARVLYFDIPLPPSLIRFTAEEVTAIPWAVPAWATPDGDVLVGQAIWIIDAGGTIIAVDPCGASDEFLRTGDDAVMHQERVASALRDAGYAAERIDLLVLTHLDGIGMAAAIDDDGHWAPMFPNARIVITDVELAFLDANTDVSGHEAFAELRQAGLVDGVDDMTELAPGVRLERTGGHSPGHAVVRIEHDGSRVVLIGHLAISPVQLATAQGPDLHLDADRANRVLDELLAEAQRDDTLLAGSLWPAPGIASIGPNREAIAWEAG